MCSGGKFGQFPVWPSAFESVAQCKVFEYYFLNRAQLGGYVLTDGSGNGFRLTGGVAMKKKEIKKAQRANFRLPFCDDVTAGMEAL